MIKTAHAGYVTTTTNAVTGATEAAKPCNAAASEEGGRFALSMMLASIGYCIADVAADGLTVSLARAEPIATRGATQTTVYLVRTLGNVHALQRPHNAPSSHERERERAG